VGIKASLLYEWSMVKTITGQAVLVLVSELFTNFSSQLPKVS
jgi:hypothetical protein